MLKTFKTKEELITYFTRYAKDELDGMARIWKRAKRRKAVMYVIGMISIFIGVLTFLPFNALVALLVGFLLYYIVFGRKRKRIDFDKECQRLIIRKLIQLDEAGLDYQSYRIISPKELAKSRLFNYPINDYNGDFLLEDKNTSSKFQISQVNISSSIPEEKPRIFEGIFFAALDNNTTGDLFILPGDDSGDAYDYPPPIRLDTFNSKRYQAFSNRPGMVNKPELKVQLDTVIELEKLAQKSVSFSHTEGSNYILVPHKGQFVKKGIWSYQLNWDVLYQYYRIIYLLRALNPDPEKN